MAIPALMCSAVASIAIAKLTGVTKQSLAYCSASESASEDHRLVDSAFSHLLKRQESCLAPPSCELLIFVPCQLYDAGVVVTFNLFVFFNLYSLDQSAQPYTWLCRRVM